MHPRIPTPVQPLLVGSIVAFAALFSLCRDVEAQEAPPAAWRVECGSDGKVLDCRALLHVVNREDKKTVAQLSVRVPPETKTPAMLIQLPLGSAWSSRFSCRSTTARS